MIESLKKLKDHAKIKGYSQPLTEEDLVIIGDWVIGYVQERTLLGVQKTVSISRSDGSIFGVTDIDIERFFELFPLKGVSFTKVFKNRGYTTMYLVE